MTVVTRLRLDAALYDPAPPREPGTKGRPRVKGERQPTLAQRLLDPATRLGDADRPLVRRRDRPGGGRDRHRPLVPPRRPARRAALGAAARSGRAVRAASPAQYRPDRARQPRSSPGSSRAGRSKSPSRRSALTSASRPSANGPTSRSSARPRPCSGSSRWSPSSPRRRLDGQPLPVRQAAWYAKTAPTFSDTLAFVRQQPLARHRFLDVTVIRRGRRNPARPLRPPHRYPGVRRLSAGSRWTKPSLVRMSHSRVDWPTSRAGLVISLTTTPFARTVSGPPAQSVALRCCRS